jgi:uncharacterized heparinase superfamily protein
LINKLSRFYHTVKYLKFKQIIWRIASIFPRLVFEVKNYPFNKEQLNSNYFIPRDEITSDYVNFKFLNETNNIKIVDWDGKNTSKLWQYNLHYFDCLLQSNSTSTNQVEQIRLIENWIDNNPFGMGTGWEPYPTSLRIINWIKWHWYCNGLTNKAKLSLWNQIRWLKNRPEYHLLGNHLFVNVKALLFASAFYGFNSESKYFKLANSILLKELDEQFLEDGAHFELSPMYHALAMEDLLDLINISDSLPAEFPLNKIKKKYLKGMFWLQSMVYQNEELSHFNDCANNIAPKISELISFASLLNLNHSNEFHGLKYHDKSGFVVFKNNIFHLIADIGHIGPTYLPGHAHADSLSFELSANGERIIVNSGTSVYGFSDERLRQRGTSSHSTIQIDSQNSSEVWSGFRVARRAKTFDIQIDSCPNAEKLISFKASHDGYVRLTKSPIHTRTFKLKENICTINDLVSGKGNQIKSNFYLHPTINLKKTDSYLILSKNHVDIVKLIFDKNINFEIIKSTYHDQFGITKENRCIQFIGNTPFNMSIKFEIL